MSTKWWESCWSAVKRGFVVFFRWLWGFLKFLFSGQWLGETDQSRISAIIFWAIVISSIAAIRSYEALLWSLAALMCGMLLGFLFGIPRVKQSDAAKNEGDDGENVGNNYRQTVNTNLEEISDWLTKIIVGVGLVQLSKIPPKFESLVNYIKIEGYEAGTIGTILVLFTVLGFFTGYLLTRLYLAAAFRRADQMAKSFSRAINEVNLPFTTQETAEIARWEDLSLTSPRAVVLEAWLQLVNSMRGALSRKRIESARTEGQMIRQFSEHGLLREDQLAGLKELQNLRNTAVHSDDQSITAKASTTYAKKATALGEQLDSIQ